MIDNAISHYKIVEKIGRGGMAEVYEAVDTNTGKAVALKVLLPHLASDEIVRQRFLREARVGMKLDHPGIVKVYEIGEDNKQPFIAMELVKGRTLDKVIGDKRLDVKRVIAIGKDIADALCVAHRQGIIHRDIKSRNIVITDNDVKIMDFGLAKVMDTSSLTEKHEIIGTLCYMSPEQAIGDAIDARTDIFSLGVVLYQMLTARLPFNGEHAGTIIHAILFSEPLRISDIDPSLPREVEQVVFKALQKNTDRRFQSATDLKMDLLKLADLLDGRPVTFIASDIPAEEVFERHRGIHSALIGREQEMVELQTRLTRMLQGRSTAVLLSGEAGIGKSRLVWELGQQAKKRDARYLMGRCVPSGGIPYQPILESIRQYFDLKGIADDKTLNKYIIEHARHLRYRMDVVASLVLPQVATKPTIADKERFWDTAAEVVKVIAKDRPIVVHLDDLHWADAPTLEMLTYILRALNDDRVLIIGTYRPEDIVEQEHPLRKILKSVKKESLVHEISLKRLDKKRTRSVIHSVFEDSAFTDRFTDSIYRETEGNPLFILEVLKLLKDENIITRHDTGWRLASDAVEIRVPKSITDVILRRLRRLDREEREIIDMAAVEGLSFQSDALAQCLDQPRIKVLRRLQNLESSHNLIHTTKQGYCFDHGRIKDAVYESLIPELRREYHKVLAKYYCEHYADNDAYAGKVAQHFMSADEEDQALPYLVRAGDYANNAWVHPVALGYYSKGIEIIDRLNRATPSSDLQRAKLNILRHRAGLQWLLGGYSEAIADANRALKLSEEVGTKQDQISAVQLLGHCWDRRGEYREAIRYNQKAMKLCKEVDDKKGFAYSLTSIGTYCWIMGNHKQALDLAKRSLKIHREIGDRYNIARDLYCVAMAYWTGAQFNKALRYLRRALTLFELLKNRLWIAFTTDNIGWCYISLRDHRRAEKYMKKASNLLRKLGEKHNRSYASMGMGVILAIRGEYRRALNRFEHGLNEGAGRSEKRTAADALIHTGLIHLIQGDFKTASGLLRMALKICRQTGLHRYEGNIYVLLGGIDFFRGDYGKSLAFLEKSLRIARRLALPGSRWLAERYLYRVWSALGDKRRAVKAVGSALRLAHEVRTRETDIMSRYDTARLRLLKHSHSGISRFVEKGLRLARRWVLADSIAEGLCLGAEMELEEGDCRKGRRYAEELLRFAEEKGRKPNQADGHLLLARTYSQTNDHGKAVTHAQAAWTIARERGMKPVLWQAHHVLGKTYTKQQQYGRARKELKMAEKIMNSIASKLDDRLRKTYLRKKEIKDLINDLGTLRKGAGRG